MTEVRKLKQQRAQVKSQLTHMETLSQDSGNMSPAETQVRLEKLEQIMEAFNVIQMEIEKKMEAAYVEGLTEELLNANEEAECQLFENRYYATAAIAQQIVNAEQSMKQGMRNQANQSNQQQELDIGIRKPKLPEIKHQYLIGVLQGEARAVIVRFEISNKNYASTWKLLQDTYDKNKRMLVENHIEALLKMPSIIRNDRAESIRKLVWHIQTHISSLKTLGQPVIYWDTLIIHPARKELDYGEQKDWQIYIKDRQPDTCQR